MTIAAGWYPDPVAPPGHWLRYWDGRQWTDYTTDYYHHEQPMPEREDGRQWELEFSSRLEPPRAGRLRPEGISGVRYYVYASDAKIDMLYSQIPPKLLNQFVGELKLDIKLLAVSLRHRETDETLFSKLKVVERYLYKHEEVGSTVSPTKWFFDQIPLHSGMFANQMVFFSGLQDGIQLVLIGSPHHMIGQGPSPEQFRISGSSLGSLAKMLHGEEVADGERQSVGKPYSYTYKQPERDVTLLQEVFEWTWDIRRFGFPERTEFLARRLLDFRTDSSFLTRLDSYMESPARVDHAVERVVIATPLYIATQ